MVRKPVDTKGRRPRRWPGLLLLAFVVGAACAAGLNYRHRHPPDPTKFGLERFLTLASTEIAPETSQTRLRVAGTTNLPDGARLDVTLGTTEDLFTASVPCRGGQFLLDALDARSVTNGTYRVLVAFRIEQQDQALREQIHYQPRRLDTKSQLVVTSATDPTKHLRPKLRALIQSANAAKDRTELARVATDAEAFERGLWISTLTPAVRRLRRALEAALRGSGKPDVERLRRELVEADVLASL
jgi:hypothetical protein